MRNRTILAAIAATALAVLLPFGSASAQDTVPVYVVHGINVAGETVVNVCAGGEEVLSDFAFTDVAGPLDLPVGATLPITVHLAPNSCEDEAIITQDVTVPGGPAALVATGNGDGGFQLTPFELDLDCAEDGQGRLSAFHASADTGTVDVEVAGSSVGQLSFTESIAADVPAGTYPVTVLLDGSPVVGPDAEVPVEDGVNTLVFVVGNIDEDTEVVPVVELVEVGTCDAPTPETTVVDGGPTGPGTQPGTAVPGGAPLSLTG